MTALSLNRIAVILAFIGIFVAGVLSLETALNLDIPCGPSGGCQKIADAPESRWFGVPVAYFGLAGYLALAVLGTIRLLSLPRPPAKIGLLALVVSGIGAVASLYLQYQAFAVIKALCEWCLTSAVVMSLLFLVNAALQSSEQRQETPGKFDSMLVPALGVAVALGLVGMSMRFQASQSGPTQTIGAEAGVTMAELVPVDAMKLGPDDAPIKIVEFSDLLCASCRRAFPELKELVKTHNGKIQLVMRHFPLYTEKGHEFSMTGSFFAEYAAEKGKGWEFVERVMDIPAKEFTSEQPYIKILNALKLDPKDASKRMTQEDPAFQRVYRDLSMADKLGLLETPTFIVLTEGQPARMVRRASLLNLLNEPAYKAKLSNG